MIVKSLVLFNILAALFFDDVDSASPEYCLAHLNMTDCGGRPTQVYHYYKPGSICKLAFWKGCPTENMFASVNECKKKCIRYKAEKVRVEKIDYRCDIPLDTRVCALQSERVFTYCNEKQSCVEADWYGCPSLNKFNDRDTCEESCYDTEIDWKNKLKNLDMRAIKEVQNVVDELLKTNDIDNENDSENDNDMKSEFYTLDDPALRRHVPIGQILRSGFKKQRKSYISKNLKTKRPKYMKNTTLRTEINRNSINASKQNETEKQNAVKASKQNETAKQNLGNASKQYEMEILNTVNESKKNETEKQNAVDASKQNETGKLIAVNASKQNATENNTTKL